MKTPEQARTLLRKAAQDAGIPNADRLHIRRDTDRGRTWAVVVLNNGGGHMTFGPEFATWPKCSAFIDGLIAGWRTPDYMNRRGEYITGSKSGQPF